MSLEILKAEVKSITKLLFKPRNSFSFSLSEGEILQDAAFCKGFGDYIEMVNSIIIENGVDISSAPYNSIDKASDGSAYLEYGFSPFVRFGKTPFILIKDAQEKVIAAFINMHKTSSDFCSKSIRAKVDEMVMQSMKDDNPMSYKDATQAVSENIYTKNNPDHIPKISKRKDLLYFVDFENNILWANDAKNANRDVRRMTAMLRNFVNYFSEAEYSNIAPLKVLRETIFEGENVSLTDYPSYSTGMLKTVGAFNLHNTIEFFAKSSNDDDAGIELTNTAKLKSRSDTASSVAFKESIEQFMKEPDSEDETFFNRLHAFAEEKNMEVKELKVQGELILPSSAIQYMKDYIPDQLSESSLGSLVDVEFKLSDSDGKMRVELCKSLHTKLLLDMLTSGMVAQHNDEFLNSDKTEALIISCMAMVGELFLETSKLFIDTFHKTNAVKGDFGDLSARFEAGSDGTIWAKRQAENESTEDAVEDTDDSAEEANEGEEETTSFEN
tara:strand:+ start:2513 stop:4006 length:1494 start_codon:yes stop_codon:yes gene_type:complete